MSQRREPTQWGSWWQIMLVCFVICDLVLCNMGSSKYNWIIVSEVYVICYVRMHFWIMSGDMLNHVWIMLETFQWLKPFVPLWNLNYLCIMLVWTELYRSFHYLKKWICVVQSFSLNWTESFFSFYIILVQSIDCNGVIFLSWKCAGVICHGSVLVSLVCSATEWCPGKW